jgi:ribonuclease VapC
MNDIHVLDASAILCMFFQEKGAKSVEALLGSSIVSTVSYAEAISKLHERNVAADTITTILASFKPTIIDYDIPQAITTAALRNATRSKGLSLGDRVCLALAASRGAIAVTTDAAWKDFDNIARILFVR